MMAILPTVDQIKSHLKVMALCVCASHLSLWLFLLVLCKVMTKRDKQGDSIKTMADLASWGHQHSLTNLLGNLQGHCYVVNKATRKVVSSHLVCCCTWVPGVEVCLLQVMDKAQEAEAEHYGERAADEVDKDGGTGDSDDEDVRKRGTDEDVVDVRLPEEGEEAVEGGDVDLAMQVSVCG